MPPTIARKQVYVLLESVGKSPKTHGFDLYLTPWTSFADAMAAWAEQIELGESGTVKVTVHEWTEAEYEDYCERNDVERP